MDHIIADLVRGMERAMLEAVARRWCAVGLAGGWAWVNEPEGREAFFVDARIDGQKAPIMLIARSEPGWYEAVHGWGETLTAGPARDVIDALVCWVERKTPRQLPLN